jgi:hypothetical protein
MPLRRIRTPFHSVKLKHIFLRTEMPRLPWIYMWLQQESSQLYNSR